MKGWLPFKHMANSDHGFYIPEVPDSVVYANFESLKSLGRADDWLKEKGEKVPPGLTERIDSSEERLDEDRRVEERCVETKLELSILERRRADEAQRVEMSWKLAEEAKRQAEIEIRRADEARRQADRAEQERYAEEVRQAEQARLRADEVRRKAEADRRQAEEDRRSAEAALKLAESLREADKARWTAEEERRKAAEERRKAEEVVRQLQDDAQRKERERAEAEERRKIQEIAIARALEQERRREEFARAERAREERAREELQLQIAERLRKEEEEEERRRIEEEERRKEVRAEVEAWLHEPSEDRPKRAEVAEETAEMRDLRRLQQDELARQEKARSAAEAEAKLKKRQQEAMHFLRKERGKQAFEYLAHDGAIEKTVCCTEEGRKKPPHRRPRYGSVVPTSSLHGADSESASVRISRSAGAQVDPLEVQLSARSSPSKLGKTTSLKSKPRFCGSGKLIDSLKGAQQAVNLQSLSQPES